MLSIIRISFRFLIILLAIFNFLDAKADAGLALHYSNKKDWDKAHAAVHEHDKILSKIIVAQQYLDKSYKGNKFEEITAFIKNNPNWPQINELKSAAEFAITDSTDQNHIISWFAENLPRTSKGYKYYALASDRIINNKQINNIIRNGWIYGDFSDVERNDFYQKHKDVISVSDNIKLIDHLLWSRKISEAKKISKLLDKKGQKYLNLCTALIGNSENKSKIYSQIPKEYKHNSGFLYLYLKSFYNDEVISPNIAKIAISAPKDIRHSGEWWLLKNRFAREMLKHHHYRIAYDIAKNHHNINPQDIAEAEWLSGWIALEFLHDHKAARSHFLKMRSVVYTPISLARAYYWLGRTEQAIDQMEKAAEWFGKAAAFNHTYYGQFALLETKRANLDLPSMPQITHEIIEKYNKNELIQATKLLIKHGHNDLATIYAKAAMPNAEHVAEVALVLNDYNAIHKNKNLFLATELAKFAVSQGFLITSAAYPMAFKVKDTYIEKALTYAIIRQETVFDHAAISPANARGLMQLVPVTACETAKLLQIRCHIPRLTSDPSYNITLGTKYLRDLIDSYDGSYILAIATYNAGPKPVNRWIKAYGDPRKLENMHQIINWIELIPYSETRNYVQRVLENMQIYRERLNNQQILQIRTDLFRGSPK